MTWSSCELKSVKCEQLQTMLEPPPPIPLKVTTPTMVQPSPDHLLAVGSQKMQPWLTAGLHMSSIVYLQTRAPHTGIMKGYAHSCRNNMLKFT
jgi:hypothetical protein